MDYEIDNAAVEKVRAGAQCHLAARPRSLAQRTFSLRAALARCGLGTIQGVLSIRYHPSRRRRNCLDYYVLILTQRNTSIRILKD